MTYQVKVSDGGKIALPAALRRKLGLEIGQTIILDDTADGVRLLSLDEVVARAQAIVARAIPAGVSLATELSEERRAASTGE